MDDELEDIRARKMRELMGTAQTSGTEFPKAPIEVNDANFVATVQKYPLVVVDCWAEWCGPCRVVSPILEDIAKEYGGKVLFAKLDVDENPDVPTRFGIMAIPTLLIMKNGKEIDRIVGALPRKQIEARIQRYLGA